MLAPALTPPAPTSRYGLPPGYREQPRNLSLDHNRDNGSYWAPWRLADSARFQVHVYRWAARLITERGLASVLDAGCGVGTKLGAVLAPVCADLHGIDQPSALAHARLRCPRATYTPADLERCDIRLGRTFDLILCADVIEHLVDPDPMLALIRTASHPGTLILLSTPERHRLRGRACTGSDKPEHVREWSMDEFRRFLESRALRVQRSRLFPQDDADPAACREGERLFRLGRADRSLLACHAVLCRPGTDRAGCHYSPLL